MLTVVPLIKEEETVFMSEDTKKKNTLYLAAKIKPSCLFRVAVISRQRHPSLWMQVCVYRL